MAKVVLFRPEVKATSQNDAFPLVEKMLYRTLAGAKRAAPVRKQKPFDKRPAGRLRKSLKKRGPKRYVNRIEGSVGSTLRYAAAIQKGAKSHIIRAKNRKNLIFFWERRDEVFSGPFVTHPGVKKSKRTDYLMKPLRKAARRYGFTVRDLP